MSDNQTDGVTIEDIDSLHRRTVRELQELAREQGIKPSGLKKKELIKRIQEEVSEEPRTLSETDESKKQQDGTQHTQPYATSDEDQSKEKKAAPKVPVPTIGVRRKRRKKVYMTSFPNRMHLPLKNGLRRSNLTWALT